jgi:hypothetical protein
VNRDRLVIGDCGHLAAQRYASTEPEEIGSGVRGRLGILGVVLVVLVTLPAASAAAAIDIEWIRYDPPGEDDGSNASLNSERIRIENTGKNARRLPGWTIHDSDHTVFYVPRLRLGGGEVVTIHTGTGTDTRRHLYWDLSIYVWDNDGDAARLYDRRMREIDTCSYTGGGTLASC